METFELRYFVEVAKHENINRAARQISVSAGSLSKAIARLESELGVNLFERFSRNIRLTSNGKILQSRAAEILRLEESVKVEIRGRDASFQVRLGGQEVLLAKVGMDLVGAIRQRNPMATFEFLPMSEEETIQATTMGHIHLGVVTSKPPSLLKTKKMLETKFQTCIGGGHPLYKLAKAGKIIPVEDVLAYEFVCPDRSLLGHIDSSLSSDGWRDDKFARRIGFTTGSLSLIAAMVSGGKAIAYLPDYYIEQLSLTVLNISGCPYTCKQILTLVAKNPEQSGWLNSLF